MTTIHGASEFGPTTAPTFRISGFLGRCCSALQKRRKREMSRAVARTYGVREISGPHRHSLRRLFEAFWAWRRRRRQKAELYALSDSALKDFGVSRWEIESIVDSPNRDASGRVR